MLRSKVCLVTGAASGIGRATAVEMARQGAAVAAADIDDRGGEETVDLVGEAGGEGAYLRCDMEEPDQIRALVAGVVERFGGLDVLHNNAGVSEAFFTDELTVETLPEEVWEKVYRINLRGIWLATKYAAPHLRRSGRGPAIVNAASIGGMTGVPQCPVYGPTKAAIIQLTKNTALDLAPVVRCNSYSPATVHTSMVERFRAAAENLKEMDRGLIATHLIPRMGEPEEVAKLVCFLASDDAAWITGSDFTIDGGAMAWRGSRS